MGEVRRREAAEERTQKISQRADAAERQGLGFAQDGAPRLLLCGPLWR